MALTTVSYLMERSADITTGASVELAVNSRISRTQLPNELGSDLVTVPVLLMVIFSSLLISI